MTARRRVAFIFAPPKLFSAGALQDGYLDADEFCVAMHLCHEIMEGRPLPEKLDPNLVPISKR